MSANPLTIYINPIIDHHSGWGNYMYNLIRYAAIRGVNIVSVGTVELDLNNISELETPIFKQFIENSKLFKQKVAAGQMIDDSTGIFLTHMSWDKEQLSFKHPNLTVGRTIGVLFFESESLIIKHIASIKANLDHVICGSHWNSMTLKRYGFEGAITILQGVDTDCYHPRIAPLNKDGNFYIFSGGKLEIRKSQDIVLESFSLIHKLIPKAKLVTQWHWQHENQAAEIMNSLGFLKQPWQIKPEQKGLFSVDIHASAKQYGIDPSAIIDLKPALKWRIAGILSQMHCAIFPSRAEGGTNLMAMEAVASGIPTITSAYNGQRDLIHLCPSLQPLALYRKAPVTIEEGESKQALELEFADWAWHDPHEIAERIVDIYNEYDQARALSNQAAYEIIPYNWENQINMLLDFIYLGKKPIYARSKIK